MKAFAMFKEPVDILVNVGSKRIRDNASKPQRPVAEFTSTLKPAHKAARRNCFADGFSERLVAGEKAARQLAIFEFGFNLRIGKLRPQCRIRKTRLRLRADVQRRLSQSGPNAEAFHSRRGRNKYAIRTEVLLEFSNE